MTEVVLTDVAKHYGQTVAVESMSLTIGSGELVALLGPSGCGKTTTLRMVGGFVPLSAGRITVGGRDVSSLPPSRRNMGFVFQNYALFPHMTVAQNVAFGLQMRGLGRDETARKVTQALNRVRLGAYADRYPRQLSGGQQQRVALARALVIEPDVLLLDEPLSNLDASLRQEMKIEIRQLQQSLGLTTIFVTHDQDEAMSTADRMVLMYRGRVEQAAPPGRSLCTPSLGICGPVPRCRQPAGRQYDAGRDRFHTEIRADATRGRPAADPGQCHPCPARRGDRPDDGSGAGKRESSVWQDPDDNFSRRDGRISCHDRRWIDADQPGSGTRRGRCSRVAARHARQHALEARSRHGGNCGSWLKESIWMTAVIPDRHAVRGATDAGSVAQIG